MHTGASRLGLVTRRARPRWRQGVFRRRARDRRRPPGPAAHPGPRRDRSSLPSTNEPRSPSAIGEASCGVPVLVRCLPGERPTATAVARSPDRPARLEAHEPEAAVVLRIFDDYVAGGHSIQEITRRLNTDAVATETGNPSGARPPLAVCSTDANEAYIGTVYWNKTESFPIPGPVDTTVRFAGTELSGSRSGAHRSSRTTSSTLPNMSAGTTAGGVPAHPLPMSGSCAGSSAAASG